MTGQDVSSVKERPRRWWRRRQQPEPVLAVWPFGPNPRMRNVLICERLPGDQVRVTRVDAFGSRLVLLDSATELTP